MTESGLPAALWTLTGLQVLNLNLNDIHTLPAGIGSLTNLTELDIYSNGLTSLPDEIGNLNKLTEMVVSLNSLTALPDTFSGLTALRALTLWGNRFTSVPAMLSSLPALDELDIAYNYLDPLAGSADYTAIQALVSGGVSVTYTPQHSYTVTLNRDGGTGANLPKAQYYHGESVTLPSCSKTGFVFGGWDLDGNGTVDAQAGGTAAVVPASVTASSVTYRAVYAHRVTFRTQSFGTVGGGTQDIVQTVNVGQHVSSVPVIAANPGYDVLGWYDGAAKVTEQNILDMDITADKVFVAKYEATGTIHFADNGFYLALAADGADGNGDGFITAAELAEVTALDLTGGSFTSFQEIGGATNLVSLTLGSCSLTVLPDEIGGLTALKALDIGGNPVSDLPAAFANLTGLEMLSLSHCAFTAVPDEIGSMAALTALDVGNNRVSSLPEWLLENDTIETLDLSGNLITSLPVDCFTGMAGLSALDLRGNYLNPGSLPAGLPGFAAAGSQTTYAVSLETLGGSCDPLANNGLFHWSETIGLPAATRDESDFVGWDTNGDGTADTSGAGTASLTPDPPDGYTSYTITAVYISKNPRLSGLTISPGAYISPVFDPQNGECTITLYDYVGSVTISPRKESAKAALLIDGDSANAITVNLVSPSVTQDVIVTVTAEDGSTTKTYTLHVRRAAPVNLALSAMGISAGVTRSPAFSPAVYSYTVLMPPAVGSVTVTATKASAAATVKIDGIAASSRAFAVNPGMTKTVTVVISVPLATDRTKTYTVTLKRGTAVSGFAAAPKLGSYPALSPGGTNRMTFSYRMAGPGAVKIEIYKSRKWVAILSRNEPSAGVKAWAWDGKVTGRYLTAGTYKVRITPSAHGMTGAQASISVKIVKAPSVSWKSYARTFRANGSTLALCTFKVNYPTNAVVQVYNSKKKIVAAVSSIANMPAAKYAAIKWNGKATAGNTAGLKAGALVPAGTYTVRITVGAKYYYKTIKITK